jgi:hypothetical protein
MKEKILNALKAKFEGVSADILDRIATMLAKTATTDEQVSTAVEGVTEELINLIEGYGDSRATGAQKTAVLNYEKKHGLKNGEKVAKGEPVIEPSPKGEDEQTPAWAKSLLESNRQLTERLNKMEGERMSASRKAELDSIINRLPENQRKGYQRISVDTMSDEEFAMLKGEVTSEVEDIVKSVGAKGAVFGRPNTNMGKASIQTSNNVEATEEEANAVLDKLNV